MKGPKVFLILLLLTIMINIVPINASSRTIKVAYPIQEGLTEVDEDGLYSGYTYEYLREICRFSNWKLEFVHLEGDINEQIVSAMEKVKSGELDLMGGMVYSQTLVNDYDYSATNYGMGNMAILVNGDDANINDTNIYSLKELNVGVISTKKEENITLRDFGNINGINIKQNFYSSGNEIKKALENHEIDAMVLSDLSIEEGDYRVVARFSPRPFYFVTTKGNRDLMVELNEAMAQLNSEQPSFMSNLHEKYFSLANTNFVLTETEKAFISENRKISVLFLGGKAPLQYYDEKEGKVVGITPDVLDYIGELSGLRFEYIYADSLNEYNNYLAKNEPMIIGGVYNSNSEDYTTTKAYLKSGVSLVTSKDINSTDLTNKRIAVVNDMEMSDIAANENQDNIIYYDTPLDCLKAVDKGIADYSYLNSHIVLFYNSNYEFDNINIIPQGNQIVQGSYFAVSKKAPLELINIMNKGVDDVLNNKIEDITFINASIGKNEVTFLDYVENNPVQVITFFVMMVAIVALFFLLWRNYMNKRNNEKILNEYQRYQQISEFSHDCFVEYNVDSDTLVLMGGGAKLLSKETIIKNYLKLKIVGHEVLADVLKNLKEYETERVVPFADGSKRWLKVSLRSVFGDLNKPTHIIGKAIDIQTEKEEQLLWRDLARRDSLTKIYNSAACREKAEKFLEQNPDCQGALLIIDIDNFKKINDTYGHLCGDILLQKIVLLLAAHIDTDDIFGRVGGDEFLIILKTPQSIDEVKEYCHRMLIAASQVEYQDQLIKTSISIGVVLFKGRTSYDELYKLADEALYKIKNRGRNNYYIINRDNENTSL